MHKSAQKTAPSHKKCSNLSLCKSHLKNKSDESSELVFLDQRSDAEEDLQRDDSQAKSDDRFVGQRRPDSED